MFDQGFILLNYVHVCVLVVPNNRHMYTIWTSLSKTNRRSVLHYNSSFTMTYLQTVIEVF